MSRYLVTSALPYANGPSHLGQVAGAYLPADIFVRFLRLAGEDVIFICGTDEHGIPITLRARREGVEPQVIVDRYHAVIRDEFAQLGIVFDNFSGTARPGHVRLSQEFFLDLLASEYLVEGTEELFWCPTCQMTLADRYVEGICPKCGDHIARGDECKVTGAWLQAADLIDPRCAIDGTPPERRESQHWFLDLPRGSEAVTAWVEGKTWWKDNVRAFVRAWIRDGLRRRSVTRDMSWGVPVPLPGWEDKVLYVWLDAPIGYISSTIEWAERIGQPERWRDYWMNPDCRLVHFIGKDNIAFHAVTWPVTLMGRNAARGEDDQFVLPYDIPANEFLTLEGRPFSTGDNWAVWTQDGIDALPTDVLRYYLAAIAPESKDSDFSWGDLKERTNKDLADTYGNLASRVLRFIQRYGDGVIPPLEGPSPEDLATLAELEEYPARIEALFRSYRVRAATAAIMDLARLGNRYYDAGRPWETRRTEPRAAGNTLHVCCRILRTLATLSWPVIPGAAASLYRQLGQEDELVEQRWADAASEQPQLAGQRLGDVDILFAKLDDAFVARQRRKLQEAAAAPVTESSEEETMPEITYDDFARLDLRVGVVLAAERVPKTDKLLKLQVDLGGEPRQVLAGIAEWYEPAALVGKRIVVLVNLEPRKIRGEVSEGMLLAADLDGRAALLHPDADVPAGVRIR